jgi:hypothetical protein
MSSRPRAGGGEGVTELVGCELLREVDQRSRDARDAEAAREGYDVIRMQ